MGIFGDIARGIAGVATGGLSEVGLSATGAVDNPFGLKRPDGQNDPLSLQDTRLLDAFQMERQAADPTFRAQGRRAVDTLGRINPEALLPLVNDTRANENALRFRQNQAREIAAQGRAGQSNALSRLSAVANRQGPSVVDAQGRIAQDNLRKSIGSQLATQNAGRFNPAAFRNALRAQSQGQVDLGQRLAAAKAEEDLANRQFQADALRSVAAGQTQARQQDLSALGLEGTLAGQQQGLVNQRANLLNSINQQRANFANQVFGRGDAAQQRALQAAGIIAGVPVTPPQPGPLQGLLGLGGAIGLPLLTGGLG